MKKSLKSGTKPLISKKLDVLLAGNDNSDAIIIETDEFDKIIRDNHLKIQRFAFFKDLDLAIFILNNRSVTTKMICNLYLIFNQTCNKKSA